MCQTYHTMKCRLYNEGEKYECEMKDLQEMMIDTASDFKDQVLQYYKADTHHPFASMHANIEEQALWKQRNTRDIREHV
jgi:hypothetical protein